VAWDTGGLWCDDYVLGKKVAESGRTVVVSSHFIDHAAVSGGFKDSLLHQLRWMRSTRFSRPVGHLGSGLTFSMPFGLLGMAAGIALHSHALAAALIVAAILNSLLMSVVAGWGVVGDDFALRDCWLYPVRDLMGFCFWAASLLRNVIAWRNQQYQLEKEGRMSLIGGAGALDARDATRAVVPAPGTGRYMLHGKSHIRRSPPVQHLRRLVVVLGIAFLKVWGDFSISSQVKAPVGYSRGLCRRTGKE
jgi:glycosyl transferase family 21